MNIAENRSDKSEMHSTHAGSRGPISALNGMKVVEVAESGATDIATIAACFAGLLASQFGAQVTRVELANETTANTGSFREGCANTLYDFLNRSKRIVSDLSKANDSILITSMQAIVEQWPSKASVLISAEQLDVGMRHSELTVQASSGLLDVFKGNNGSTFLALPGNQMAYASGMAAFNAIVSTQLTQDAGQPLEQSTVNIVDVACWINWKKYLTGPEESRLPQEWITVSCSDGYVTLVYQDKHVPLLAELTGNDLFSQASLKKRSERSLHLWQFRNAFQSWAKHRTRAEIFKEARRLRIPIGPVLNLSELPDDEQFKYRGFFVSDTGRTFPRLPLVVRRIERSQQ